MARKIPKWLLVTYYILAGLIAVPIVLSLIGIIIAFPRDPTYFIGYSIPYLVVAYLLYRSFKWFGVKWKEHKT